MRDRSNSLGGAALDARPGNVAEPGVSASGTSPHDGPTYVPVTDPADPGEQAHAAHEHRSRCPCGKPSEGGAAAPAAAAPPTSLDALETSPHALADQTRPQLQIHARHRRARYAIWRALWRSTDPVLNRRADRIEGCCRFPTLRRDASGKLIICRQRCRDRCCPHCAWHRSRDAAARATEACRHLNAARFLTLTVPHVPAPLADQLKALRAAFTRLRRTKSWRAHVPGGIYGLEVKLSTNDGRWHPHLHAVIDGTYYPQDEIREMWRLALNNPDSPWKIGPDEPLMVHIEAVLDRRKVGDYVGKYVTKPADLETWPELALAEYAAAMHGQRLLHTFGTLHGVKLDPADPNDDPAATTHVASLATLNAAARRGQRSAKVALLLFRIVFPTLSAWTEPGPSTLPADIHRPDESIADTLARVAASAERQFWDAIDEGRNPPPTEPTRKPPPRTTLPLPYPEHEEPAP